MTRSNSKDTCPMCGSLRSNVDSGAVQPTSAADKTIMDIVNSRHVCGGKDSICEFLRSQPTTQSSSDKRAQCPKAAEKDNICEFLLSKPKHPTGPCGNAEKAHKQEEHCQRDEPGRNSSGPKEEKHRQLTKPGLLEPNHCPCVKPTQGPGIHLVCECFCMAEPYMLEVQALVTLEKDGGQDPQQQPKKQSCPLGRLHRHSKTSKKTVEPTKPIHVVSHHGQRVVGTKQSQDADRKTSSCKCRCHLD